MSILDKVIGAVTPPESDQARADAHAKARAAAQPGGWLALILDHHEQIFAALDRVQAETSPLGRRTAQKALAEIVTAHSVAEEVVTYPTLALNGEKIHAQLGYTEQSATKVQFSALEDLDPMTQDYMDKFEHIRGALLHHIYAEEHNWFLDLQDKATPALQSKLLTRYQEEFGRYMGRGTPPQSAQTSTTLSAAAADARSSI